MKKPLLQEYVDEIKYNHDITGVPRVRAEWNWNHTGLLANPAKRGVRMKVYDGSGIGVPANATAFNSVFTQARLKKELYHPSCNWTHTSNTPNVDWTNAPKYNPTTKQYFGVEQTFFMDIHEPGQWKFYMASDDGHELYVNNVKITSWYGGRIMDGPPNWTENGTYTFPSAGRYEVRIRMHNVDREWGVFLGYQSPTMIQSNVAAREIEREKIIHPDEALGPYSNPERVGFNPDTTPNKAWDAWRKYFPVSSLVEKIRPLSGIHYNDINSRNDDCFVMNDQNFIQYEDYPKPHRWYLLDRENQGYRYWKSDKPSNASGALSMDPIRIHYNDWVGANKITATFNLGPRPTSFEIRAFVRTNVNDPGQWVVIHSAGTSINWTSYIEGQVNYYRKPNGTWGLQPVAERDHFVYAEDYSIELNAIELTIFTLSKTNARAEVIEFSARKQLDVTDRIIEFSCNMTMEDTDFTRIIGKMSANDGRVKISNWDNAFQMPEEVAAANGVERLGKTVDRSTKFTFDLMYDLSNQGVAQPYPVRMFTMYSADWTREGEFDYEVNLFDSAKYLQNTECPEIFEKSIRLHELVAQILDSVGFTRYTLDSEDFMLNSPVLEFFANDADATVWETLQKIASATLCAIYFDEYDTLHIMTKDELTRDAPADYQLLGQVNPDDSAALPNFSSIERIYNQEANKVTIKWRDKSIKKDKLVDIDPTELTDIVWQSSETITLRAVKLVKPMSKSEENEFWIKSEDAIDWPYQGKANINGEIIEWDGKEYAWIDGATNTMYTEIIRSQEELVQRNAKALYGYNQYGVNKFTGRIFLKREEKTGRPIGRAVDSSKYRVDHPIDKRPGWQPAMFTVGTPNVVPGWWSGEKNTSWYVVNNDNDNTTSIGINRPHRNDDWFKTQILYRNSSPGTVLQQWGFKMKFKESTTIGELSLMFNMGTCVANNAELATTLGGPLLFNQMYHITFLETQGLVRNATHEVGAWVQTPDPVFRTWDNAIRGTASRMYNRNYWEPWSERMKGYRCEFKRDTWYDVRVDLTRGRGYRGNEAMHFFVWVNGNPVGGFDAAGPANRHKFLAPTNYWAIGSRAASKVEIAHAYSWTEWPDPQYEEDQYKWDFTNGSYVSSYLENGILYPAKGRSAPYRDGAQFAGEFFFDDFGSVAHEIREWSVNLDKAPVETVKTVISNPDVRELELTYSPNKAKFSVVNTSDKKVIAHGQENLPGGTNSINHSMVLYGYVLTEGDENSITREDKDSIKDRGEVKEEINADWVNNKEEAENLAKWVVQHFAEPKDVVQIEAFGDASYGVGDRINIHYDKGDIKKEWLYVICGVDYGYSAGGLEVNLTARRVRNNDITDEQ